MTGFFLLPLDHRKRSYIVLIWTSTKFVHNCVSSTKRNIFTQTQTASTRNKCPEMHKETSRKLVHCALLRKICKVIHGQKLPNAAKWGQTPSSNPVEAELSLILHFCRSPTHICKFIFQLWLSSTWKLSISRRCQHKLAVSVQVS